VPLALDRPLTPGVLHTVEDHGAADQRPEREVSFEKMRVLVHRLLVDSGTCVDAEFATVSSSPWSVLDVLDPTDDETRPGLADSQYLQCYDRRFFALGPSGLRPRLRASSVPTSYTWSTSSP
jgi:hypothetical protein